MKAHANFFKIFFFLIERFNYYLFPFAEIKKKPYDQLKKKIKEPSRAENSISI